MEDKVLTEVRQIRRLLSEIIGTENKPVKEKFSKEAISKAAKEYRTISIKRGEWLSGSDIRNVIKHAPNYPAKLIIEKFKFTNYFKRGHTLYLNRNG